MDMGHSPAFHASWASLCEAIHPPTPTASAILIDLSIAIDATRFSQIQSEHKALHLIGFESLTAKRLTSNEGYLSQLSQSLVLPPHAERAKSRLKSVLRHTQRANAHSPSNQRKAATNLPRLTKSGFKRAATQIIGSSRKLSPVAGAKQQDAQYMATRSAHSLTCLREIQGLDAPNMLLLQGEEGTEFEIIAREINFQLFKESNPLHILPADELRLDSLEKLERAAKSSQSLQCCLIGKTEDLTENSARELGLYIEYLDNLRNPHLCIILCHELESEAYFHAGMIEHYQQFVSKLHRIEIPAIRQRAEDIPYLCRHQLAALRTAHPFLQVHAITNEAIDYLVQNKENFTYDKIVRTLRNAMALSKRTQLCVEDLINYGESDHVTQHLLESMADEQFFPTAAAANS
jgi:DNA-binding NtrC family response regulator